MTLHYLLIFIHWFITTHVCDVWQPDSTGLGNHPVFAGNCVDGFNLGRQMHTTVTWTGIPPEVTQGLVTFP